MFHVIIKSMSPIIYVYTRVTTFSLCFYFASQISPLVVHGYSVLSSSTFPYVNHAKIPFSFFVHNID